MLKSTTLSMFLLLSGGCMATVYPQSRPLHPTPVYLTDYGIHSSLLLPAGDGRYVEYAYGDWNFAALNHCWPQDVVGALLLSGRSTLGRRYVNVPPGQTVPRPVHPSPHSIKVIYGSEQDVQRLVREMDERYRRDATESRRNPDNDMDYVPDSEHYSIVNNCNHLTVRCLREIGCDVRGIVVLSGLAVAPAAGESQIAQARKATSPPATMPSRGTSSVASSDSK